EGCQTPKNPAATSQESHRFGSRFIIVGRRAQPRENALSNGFDQTFATQACAVRQNPQGGDKNRPVRDLDLIQLYMRGDIAPPPLGNSHGTRPLNHGLMEVMSCTQTRANPRLQSVIRQSGSP